MKGRITSITDAQQNKTEYQYDGEGNLIKIAKTPSPLASTSSPLPQGEGQGEGGAKTTRYLYDGDNILSEYDETNNLKTRYTHNLQIDDPLVMERVPLFPKEGSGEIYYYHKDALGSITAITDEIGNTVQTYEYDPFGNITYQQDPNFIQPFTFTGREYDQETGLYFYRARTYNSKIGAFMQEDPIGFEGGDSNLYGYVGNNPVNWVDPWGLWYVDIGFNIPIHPIFGGVSLDIQIGSGGVMLVPGIYIGTPGVSIMAVTGDPTAGLQSSISGGYVIGGVVTSYGQNGPYSGGLGLTTPGVAVEILQWGIPLYMPKPPTDDKCKK